MSAAKSQPALCRIGRNRGALLLLLLGLSLQACSAKLVPYGERGAVGFRHRTIGYTISMPDWGGLPPWRRIRVKGSDLTFRNPSDGGRSSMSLMSQCRRTRADPAVLARHLTIGIPERQIEHSGPVELAGDPGWSQTFVTRQGGISVRVKTVTLIGLPCIFDWILVMPGPFGEMERVFDRWWASFEFHSRPGDGPDDEEVAP